MSQNLATGARVLPRSPEYYVHSPRETFRKVTQWLAARVARGWCGPVGAGTRVTGKIFTQNGGSIRIGERVQLLSHFSHSVLATFPSGVIEIGDRTVLNYGVDICATKLV